MFNDENNPELTPENNTTPGEYSYNGASIPQNRVEFRSPGTENYQNNYNPGAPAYEASYDSRSGNSYSNAPVPPAAPPVQKKSSGKGFTIAAVCIGLVLSIVLGATAGYLAGRMSGSSGGINEGIGETPSATVDRYTTVVMNQATNQTSAIATASQIASNSVVIIDTFNSEADAEMDNIIGSGSGVIWTADGYIVTCNHVIDDAGAVRVTLTDGSTHFAAVVGKDSETDVAVLKIAASENLHPVMIRDVEAAPLNLGETCIAIGNPLGVLGGTTTSGIISALERNITIEGKEMKLLQMDASVNSGNSGGGLFDINGSLIGIVNAKSTGSNVEGIGFAIPIATADNIAKELIENGYVTGRPQLGISIVGVTDMNYSYIFNADYYPDLKPYATKQVNNGWGHTTTTYVPGVYIYSTDSVAGYAEGCTEELKFGDKLLFIGSTAIDGMENISGCLSGYTAGDTIDVTVLRNQTTTIIIQVVLGQAGI